MRGAPQISMLIRRRIAITYDATAGGCEDLDGWPSAPELGACRNVGAAANLDSSCARRRPRTAGDEPARQAKLDNGDQCAVRIKPVQGSAKIIQLLHGALPRFILATTDAIISDSISR